MPFVPSSFLFQNLSEAPMLKQFNQNVATELGPGGQELAENRAGRLWSGAPHQSLSASMCFLLLVAFCY